MSVKAITVPRLGSVNTFGEVAKVVTDIQQYLDQLGPQVAYTFDSRPAAGTIKFLAQESDGTYHLWSLVAGSGTHVVLDTTARTATITAP